MVVGDSGCPSCGTIVVSSDTLVTLKSASLVTPTIVPVVPVGHALSDGTDRSSTDGPDSIRSSAEAIVDAELGTHAGTRA